jgi:hypothetical protein
MIQSDREHALTPLREKWECPRPPAGRGGTCRVRVRRAAVARLSLLPRLIIPNLTSILRYALGAQQQMWPD